MVKHEMLRIRISNAGFFQVDTDIRINQEEKDGGSFCQYGSDGGSFDTHFRQTEFTENQCIVQYYVGQCHDDGINGQYFGTGDTDV